MKGKVAIVTAANKGKTLGYGCAEAFAQAGADVVAVGRSMGKLKGARELERYGVRVLPVCADASRHDQVESAVGKVVEAFGRIDVLVNCAQVAKSGAKVQDLTYADIELALGTGLKGAFHWMAACHPHLRQTKGCVVNFTSSAGALGRERQAPLAVAKDALRALSNVAANEWREDGIRVECVDALARTAQFDQWAREFPEAYEVFIRDVPEGELVQPLDIGRKVVELCRASAAGLTSSLS